MLQQNTFFGHYNIPPNQKNLYENLFSILVVTDSIESDFCEGRLSEDNATKSITQLKDQFNRLRSILNFNKAEIEKFCTACHINLPYALNVLFSEINHTENLNSTERYQEAMNLGTNFTTLMDLCQLKIQEPIRYNEIILKIKVGMGKLGLLESKEEIYQIMTKWVNAFSQLRPMDKVSNELILELESDMKKCYVLSME